MSRTVPALVEPHEEVDGFADYPGQRLFPL
jgi:hypothetical protein